VRTANAGAGLPSVGALDRQRLLGVLIVAGATLGLAVANLEMAHSGAISSSAWLPNAFGVALLLRARASNELGFLFAFAAAMLSANMCIGASLAMALIEMIANSLVILAVTRLTRRTCGDRPDMARLHHLARFVWAGGLIGPAISRAFAALAFQLDGQPVPSGIFARFTSDAMGMVVLVPTVLLASDAVSRRIARKRVGPPANERSSTRSAPLGIMQYAAVLAAGITCVLVVFDQPHYPLLFLIPPVTLLHAFRLGPLGTAVYVVTVAIVACAMTIAGTGPIFAATPSSSTQGHLLQAFIAANFLTGLPVSASLAGRDRMMLDLATDKERLDLLAQNITDAIMRYDQDGICIYASPSASDVLGVSPEELVGQPISAGLHEDARGRVMPAFERLICARSERERIIFRRLRDSADGSPAHLEADCAIARHPVDGGTIGIVVAARDVSERVELEALLNRARRKAENAAQAKSEFLAAISQEIRTPMNVVLGFAELMLEGELDPDQRRQAKLIVESGRSMMLLLNDILDLSKI